MTTTKTLGEKALEDLKNRASQQLLQIIYQASKGYEHINIQKVRNVVDDIVMASLLENQLLVSVALENK